MSNNHPVVHFAEPPSLRNSRFVTVTEKESSKGDNEGCTGDSKHSDDPKGILITRSQVEMESLALYEEDIGTVPTLASFLKSFTLPGAEDRDVPHPRKAKLGTLLGVYLPTMQHIFGVIMFLRVFWIVGTAGVFDALILIFMCCLCTFLTSISMSAIATNGMVESGGSYFMISRNLGPEFGTAVGVLFYLANTVATAMYLVGGVEILLTYLAPDLPQFTGSPGAMFNNFRLYASGLLCVEFGVVAVGVIFVQIFAPISLSCVIISVISIYIGSLVANEDNSSRVCLVGNLLVDRRKHFPNLSNATCNHASLWEKFCTNATFNNSIACSYLNQSEVSWTAAVPGFGSGVMSKNLFTGYTAEGYSWPNEAVRPDWAVKQDITSSFFTLLAIYFPSVTGIMTGSNMSGDLRDPQKSIPFGTIAAQLTTSFVYLSFALVFGGSIIRPVLLDKFGQSLGGGMVVAQLAWPTHWVLLIGSFTSTFGAALQCLCSAPRLLQSIAKDDVLPFLAPFAVRTKRGEPFRALLLTALLAECAILIGNIDYIAPVVDFFFLMCYGFVNIVCALQTLMKSPNWRPRFRFYHWTLSLLGAGLCLFIMFSTYWYYAIVTLLLCGAIYKYVEYTGARKEWGDGIRGLALTGARFSLLKLEDVDQHTKNWRPQLLCFLRVDPEQLEARHSKLLSLASQLKAGGGLVVCASIVEGDFSDAEVRARAKATELLLKENMAQHKVKGFAKCVVCREVSDGFSVTIQSMGIGALRPNTVMVGWPSTRKTQGDVHQDPDYFNFLDAIHRVATADMVLLIPKGITFYADQEQPARGTIDVWWIMHDGGMLILLPFLLKKHRVWRNCKIRVFSVATQFDNSVMMKACLDQWIYQLRIDAQVQVVELPGSDVTAYISEKTLQLEARNEFLKELHLTDKEITAEPQAILDKVRLRDTTYLRQNKSEGQFLSQGPGLISRLFDSDDADLAVMATSAEDVQVMNQYTFTPSSATAGFKKSFSVPNAAAMHNFRGSGGASGLLMVGEVDSSCASPANSNGMEGAQSIDDVNGGSKSAFSPSLGGVDEREETTTGTTPSEMMQKKMHTAQKLNAAIRKESSEADLVVVNLPRPPRKRESLGNYIGYVNALTEGLDKVLLVRGTGREVITMYS